MSISSKLQVFDFSSEAYKLQRLGIQGKNVPAASSFPGPGCDKLSTQPCCLVIVLVRETDPCGNSPYSKLQGKCLYILVIKVCFTDRRMYCFQHYRYFRRRKTLFYKPDRINLSSHKNICVQISSRVLLFSL